MKLNALTLSKFSIAYLIVLMVLYYLLRLLGLGDAKWQIYLYLIVPLMATLTFRRRLRRSDLIYYFVFFCYGFLLSCFSFDKISSLIYVVAFTMLVLPATLISNARNINVGTPLLSRFASYFVYLLPTFSFLNLFIGKDYVFPFTVNISVFDTIWAAVFPISMYKAKLKDKILLTFSSVMTAYFHDAEAMYVLIVFYFIARFFLKNPMLNTFVSFFVKNIFTKSMVVYVLVVLILNEYYPTNEIVLDGLRGELRDADVGYFKRLTLIIQGYYYASENFFFGVGFGVNNYITASSNLVHNTPQIMFLTMNIYAGVVGMLLMFRLVDRALIFRIKSSVIESEAQIAIYISIIMFFLMISIHEYLFNPLVMFSLVFITTFKVASEQSYNDKLSKS